MASKLIGQKLTPETQFSLGIKFKIVKPEVKGNQNRVRLEHKEDGHNKFYVIELLAPHTTGNNKPTWCVQATYGKLGTHGSDTKYTFAHQDGARKQFHKKIQEKLKKGYKRVS